MFEEVDRERRVETKLPPIGDAIGEFGRAVEAMVWDQTAEKIRLPAPGPSVIQVLFDGPLSNLGNLGIVDLNSIRGPRP
jgi:hypothetical protein